MEIIDDSVILAEIKRMEKENLDSSEISSDTVANENTPQIEEEVAPIAEYIPQIEDEIFDKNAALEVRCPVCGEWIVRFDIQSHLFSAHACPTKDGETLEMLVNRLKAMGKYEER